MKPTTIICDGAKLKRIAVTCKCGNRFVESIPGEAIAGGAHPVLECGQCKQAYALVNGKIRRFDFGQLGKELSKKEEEAQPIDAELTDSGEVKAQDRAAWEMPASKLVN